MESVKYLPILTLKSNFKITPVLFVKVQYIIQSQYELFGGFFVFCYFFDNINTYLRGNNNRKFSFFFGHVKVCKVWNQDADVQLFLIFFYFHILRLFFFFYYFFRSESEMLKTAESGLVKSAANTAPHTLC